MKNIYAVVSLFVFFAFNGLAQNTLVLQPDSANGNDVSVFSNNDNSLYDELDAVAWTAGGVPYVERALLNFDLSSIPQGATIQSASLSLYYNPNASNGGGEQSQVSGSNAAWIQRITSSWNRSTVEWNTLPTTTTLDEATIPASTSDTESYTIDVTGLVQDMVNNPSGSFGFMLMLQTEENWRSLVFGSSRSPNSAIHPKLEITYGGFGYTVTQKNVSCHGKSDGSAKISVSGGTPPYTFSWLPDVSSDSVATGLAAGNYLCGISDSGGVHSQNVFVIITQPNVLTLTPSVTDPVCTNNNGVAGTIISGGTGPFNYLWSNSSTTQTATGLSAGTYSVIVTDANGCVASGSDTLVTQFSTLVLIDSTVNSPCGVSTGSASVVPTGGAAPYSFSWSNNDSTERITNLAGGIYFVTVTDQNGCSVTNKLVVGNNPIPADSVPNICILTVDSLSQYNIIMWDNSSSYSSQVIDSVIIYREITSNNYEPIGAVAYNAASLFVDTVRTLYFPNTGNPNEGTYRYKIGVLDVCGNYSALCPWQNTLYIENNNGVFTWPYPYAIENDSNPVIAYILLRNNTGVGSWQEINSVAGTQQFVTDADYNTYKNTATWCVATQWDIDCSPTLRIAQTDGINYNSSRSNSQGVNVPTNVNSLSNNTIFSISPNPATTRLLIHASSFIPNEAVTVSVVNVLGQETLPSMALLMNGADTTVDISKLSAGMYFLQMKTANGSVVNRFVKE